MNFADDPVPTQTLQFMDLGFSNINVLYERSGLSTPATRIKSPTYGCHCSAPDRVFGESTVVGINSDKSDHDYNYKTEFQILRENQEFERQNVLMSRPPLDLTHIGTNTKNAQNHIWT